MPFCLCRGQLPPCCAFSMSGEWYDGKTVMQLQYGPIGMFFTEQDATGKWKSIRAHMTATRPTPHSMTQGGICDAK